MTHRDSPKLQGILKNDDNAQTAQNGQAVSPSTLLNIRHAQSPREGPKSVSIDPYAETISPMMLGKEKDVDDLELDRVSSGPRAFKAKGPNSKRLSGRRARNASVTSLPSLDPSEGEKDEEHHLFSGGLVGQITAWLREERKKRDARKTRKTNESDSHGITSGVEIASRSRRRSSGESVDLSRLEQILKESIHFDKPRKPSLVHPSIRKRPSLKTLHKNSSNAGQSSDTEYHDGDALVPSAEAWLDNTKTLASAGGGADPAESTESLGLGTRQAWSSFKYEIVRLTHTLRIKGWRRVPMDMSNECTVERLSGALTNAVYVVSPPKTLPPRPTSADGQQPVQRPPPAKLLLRIYGPQVEHLIDRESELQILRRLARKRIGPRMLGTFSNGRFEEYFHAKALDPQDLRNADTSKQIAKRMRELHEGIDLLERERDEGAFVWQNWDKWFQRVQDVTMWLDSEVLKQQQSSKSDQVDGWQTRGFVCGTEWAVFKRTVQKYREWLEAQYTEPGQLRSRYVFAHNDTQYGNILRLLPSGTSPLLLPANTHKQLIVIDFEYSNANTPGLEFANHFTEWCYNYHDEKAAWLCNTALYPTPEEQDRFLRAYVRHRPQFNAPTPNLGPADTEEKKKRPQGPTSSISNFMLDARGPPESPAVMEKVNKDYQDREDAQVQSLLAETKMWRLANSAQWVAWGIVQAKVPGLPDATTTTSASSIPLSETPDTLTPTTEDNNDAQPFSSDPLSQESQALQQDIHDKRPDPNEEDDEAAEEEFDYLAYARDRAMFFWGDAVELGLIDINELPEDVRLGLKRVGR
ncbi:kinase-like protein [Aureobasidium subglaciale]|nr:kinase-like protein [Aureobasidium subglaciale]KAI5214431.1 kinase-like protein [Aureobasidium subglaciale]KAI5216998.1 kinase-like protein [Aureobasidium subglaciale]KAI5254754.1 kinase-like protein [Aureobasidium subglaciale]